VFIEKAVRWLSGRVEEGASRQLLEAIEADPGIRGQSWHIAIGGGVRGRICEPESLEID
jgi:hypothetical protein